MEGPDSSGVRIEKVPPIREDARGGLFFLDGDSARPYPVLVEMRAVGDKRGGHYHLGANSSNAPAMHMVTGGRLLFRWAQVENDASMIDMSEAGTVVGEVHEVEVHVGTWVVVPVLVWHQFEALEPHSTVIEYLATPDHARSNAGDVRYLKK